MLTRNNFITGIMALTLILSIGSCKKDATTASTTYQLKVKDQLGVSGTVKFIETNATITTIEIVLTGASAGSHPAHIHFNSAVETGDIALTLSPVVNGKSTTTVTALDNSTTINYAQLIAFDGYINVHESAVNLSTILAQGDIGGNLLTATNKTYTLNTEGALGVSGTALFEKRVNGKTLVTISLDGTLAGDMHPAAIHLGSVETVGGGPIVRTLNDVDGTTGKSYTNIRTLNDATPVTYDNLLVYDGYLAVTQSAVLPDVILCQGNIGSN